MDKKEVFKTIITLIWVIFMVFMTAVIMLNSSKIFDKNTIIGLWALTLIATILVAMMWNKK